MIVICFLLLILVGFEQKLESNPSRFAVPLIISYGLVFILELIHNRIFKLMKVVVISLTFVLTVFLTLWLWNGLNTSLQCGFINYLYEIRDLLTTFFLLFPLVVHVVRLWLRSSVQRGYLRTMVEKETTEYQKAIQALTIGKPSGVSKKYLDAWEKVENPKDPDPDTTRFTDLYVQSVVKALYPSDVKLILSFVWHWILKIWRWSTGWLKKK